MYTGIGRSLGDRLKRMADAEAGQAGRSIVPFGHRPIPQPLNGGAALLWFELLGDLYPCGDALACALDITQDPPEPDYEKMFFVRDLMHLSGKAGDHGVADPNAIAGADAESETESGETLETFAVVNIGPACEESSSSSPSEESSSSSPSEESLSSLSSLSDSSAAGSSSSCSGGMYWVPIRDCSEDSESSGSITGWQIAYLPPGTCPPSDEWQPATFPGGAPTPPIV
jgi:hypothetical protein